MSSAAIAQIPQISRTVALPASNNFDLIRLLVATQVMLKHVLVHLGFDTPATELLGVFPGVPIFFFISGYLIFRSWHNSKGLYPFAVNRLLRIYPGLIVCFAVSIAMVLATGYLQGSDLASRPFLIWAAAQLSIGQIYNAELMRGFGVGVLNGSLWTVAVELQFYLLTPVLAWLVLGRRWMWSVILAVGVCANLALLFWSDGFAAKLFSVSFPPWFYMFALGAWLSTREDWQEGLLRMHPLVLLAAYVLVVIFGHVAGARVTGNETSPLSYVLLAALIFRLAHAAPALSDRLLRRNDISYGVYIYHMPAVNLLAFYGISGTLQAVLAAISITFVLAIASWRFVERPALRLKKLALRNY